jgi:hypothetical protein
MASWRDAATPEAQVDLDGLLGNVLPFAQQQLAQHGAFHPFGAVVADDGSLRLAAAYDGSDNPPAQPLLEQLYEGTRSQRSAIRAVAFVADVRLPGTSEDAIRVELEHRDGVAIAVVLPYRKRRSGRAIEYEALRGAAAQQRIWTE